MKPPHVAIDVFPHSHPASVRPGLEGESDERVYSAARDAAESTAEEISLSLAMPLDDVLDALERLVFRMRVQVYRSALSRNPPLRVRVLVGKTMKPRPATQAKTRGWALVETVTLYATAKQIARKLRKEGYKARIRWNGSNYLVEVRCPIMDDE